MENIDWKKKAEFYKKQTNDTKILYRNLLIKYNKIVDIIKYE